MVILVPSKYSTPLVTPPVEVPVPPFPTPNVPVRSFVPIEAVAMTCPALSTARTDDARFASVSCPALLKLEVAVPPK